MEIKLNKFFTIKVFDDGEIDLIISGNFNTKCYHCGGEIKPHQLGFIHYPMNGKAIDIHMKCIQCGKFHTFGIPIDSETEEKISEHQGKFFKWWGEKNEYGEVMDRLSKLGYW